MRQFILGFFILVALAAAVQANPVLSVTPAVAGWDDGAGWSLSAGLEGSLGGVFGGTNASPWLAGIALATSRFEKDGFLFSANTLSVGLGLSWIITPRLYFGASWHHRSDDVLHLSDERFGFTLQPEIALDIPLGRRVSIGPAIGCTIGLNNSFESVTWNYGVRVGIRLGRVDDGTDQLAGLDKTLTRQVENRDIRGGTLRRDGDVLRLVFSDVSFTTGSDRLAADAVASMIAAASTLKAYVGVRLVVEGHTDNIGREEDNLALSAARARAVATVFIAAGFDKGSLVSKGFGSSRPVADNASWDGQARNRRVEIRIQID